jgi:hypothetical protein
MSLQERLNEYVRACFTGIWIESHQHHDAIVDIAKLCRQQEWQLASWDIEQGLQVPGAEVDAASSGPLAAIRSVNSLATPDGTAILVLQNFHRFMQSAEIVQALAQQVVAGKQNRTILIVLSPVVQLPTELEKMFVVIEHELSGANSSPKGPFHPTASCGWLELRSSHRIYGCIRVGPNGRDLDPP